jgi:hypothetical protein
VDGKLFFANGMTSGNSGGTSAFLCKPTLAGQLQSLGPGTLGQLPNQLLVHRNRRGSCHICHRCLLFTKSYTGKFTVPFG